MRKRRKYLALLKVKIQLKLFKAPVNLSWLPLVRDLKYSRCTCWHHVWDYSNGNFLLDAENTKALDPKKNKHAKVIFKICTEILTHEATKFSKINIANKTIKHYPTSNYWNSTDATTKIPPSNITRTSICAKFRATACNNFVEWKTNQIIHRHYISVNEAQDMRAKILLMFEGKQ